MKFPKQLIANCEDLCIQSSQLDLDTTIMYALSAHGGLVHVVLAAHFVAINGVICLIHNSPNLFTFHIHTTGKYSVNPRILKSVLKEDYSHRKLLSRDHGSYQLLRGDLCGD